LSPDAVTTGSTAATTTDARQPIGVFDSGIGGLSVLNALQAELPHEHFVYFADTAHAPYGERGDAYVAARTRAVAQYLIGQHRIKALVVACNTATAAAIHLLRADHPALPLVGLEPALKPAAASSKTRHVAVLATRGTLESHKFGLLHGALAGQARFSLVPCDGLASAIEHADTEEIAALAVRYMHAAGRFGTAPDEIDTLVLGCTHYPFIADVLRRHAGASGEAVHFIDTGLPVAQQTRRMLAAARLLAAGDEGPGGEITAAVRMLASAASGALDEAAARWLAQPACATVVANPPVAATPQP
jgi:glutamate racemase